MGTLTGPHNVQVPSPSARLNRAYDRCVVPSAALPSERCSLISAPLDRLVQLRGLRAAAIERDGDEPRFRVCFYVLHARNLHQRLAQLSHALVAIIACGRDLNAIDDLVVSGVVKIVRVRRFHRCIQGTRAVAAARVSFATRRATGSKARHTLSASTFCPAAFG